MASKNCNSLKFLERTNQLATRLGISLRALAPEMGLSVASLFGYRNGSIPVSPKAWKKLEQAERASGLSFTSALPTSQNLENERSVDLLSAAALGQETGDPTQRMLRHNTALEGLMDGLRGQMNEIFEQAGLSIPMVDFISMMKAAGAWPIKKEDEQLTFVELIRKYSGTARDSGGH